jgi:hypothetical protein
MPRNHSGLRLRLRLWRTINLLIGSAAAQVFQPELMVHNGGSRFEFRGDFDVRVDRFLNCKLT